MNLSGNQFVPKIQQVTVGDTITWVNQDITSHDTVSGSNAMPSGVWDSKDAFGGSLMNNGEMFSFTFNIDPGNYRYYCTPHWATGGMTGLVMVVAAPNQPPTVTITKPMNNQAFLVGSNILLQVATSDTDGTVSSVEFRTNGTPLGTALGPFDFTFTNPPPGNYTLTARATDNLGAMSTSAPVNIFVLTNALLSPPTFTNGQAQFTISGIADQTYIIDASTNLNSASNWLPIATNNAPANLFLFVDPAATNTQRFYRARQNY